MDNETYKLEVLKHMQRQTELLELLVDKKYKPVKPKVINLMTLLEQLEPHKGKYAPSMIEEFTDYWSECERWKRELLRDRLMLLIYLLKVSGHKGKSQSLL